MSHLVPHRFSDQLRIAAFVAFVLDGWLHHNLILLYLFIALLAFIVIGLDEAPGGDVEHTVQQMAATFRRYHLVTMWIVSVAGLLFSLLNSDPLAIAGFVIMLGANVAERQGH